MLLFEKRMRRICLATATALLVSACFQPLHTSGGTSGAPGISMVRAQLASIDVAEPRDRLAQQIREHLVFQLTGGSGQGPVAYRLSYVTNENVRSAVVDPFTNRPETETVNLTTDYTLAPVGGTGLPVVTGRAFAQASYERSRQRFAGLRAQEDARDRAAKLIADQIFARLATHFAQR